MTVWVTGAHGMLGRAIGRQLEAQSLSWVGTDSELDIADPVEVEQFVGVHRPSLLINCAAYTAVDAAESDVDSARRVNSTGPGVLARAARQRGCDFVHISTDYVFGGQGTVPFREDAAIAPGNVYGVTKAEGESLVAREFDGADPRNSSSWWIIRTSWLFGTGRSSFVDTMWTLMKSKEELRVVDDQVGRPTYVEDLASAALAIPARNRQVPTPPSGVFHFANQGTTSWYGLACEIRAGMVALGEAVAVQRIVPVATSEFPRPALRPAYSVLSTERIEREARIIPRDWRLALKEYLNLRAQSESRARS